MYSKRDTGPRRRVRSAYGESLSELRVLEYHLPTIVRWGLCV
jgi:hypothetical protein